MARATTPVMLDVDPGHDDAVALVLACAAPELEVRAVTTVAGNAPLPETTRNALRVLSLLGRGDVPVGAGAAAPLARPLYTAGYAHGEGGLGRFWPDDGPVVPEADGRGAVDLMADVVEGSEEPVTLVALAPLTNVATFLARRPDLTDRVARVVLMGGSAGRGNVTPVAEFNFYVDPEAARAVFRSGLALTMCGLDATRKAVVGPEELERLRVSSGRSGELVAKILASYADAYGEAPGPEALAIHDAVAVAAVVEPKVLKTRPVRVEIDCDDEPTRGRSICDLDGVGGREPNAEVALDLDTSAFFEVMHRFLRGRAG